MVNMEKMIGKEVRCVKQDSKKQLSVGKVYVVEDAYTDEEGNWLELENQDKAFRKELFLIDDNKAKKKQKKKNNGGQQVKTTARKRGWKIMPKAKLAKEEPAEETPAAEEIPAAKAQKGNANIAEKPTSIAIAGDIPKIRMSLHVWVMVETAETITWKKENLTCKEIEQVEEDCYHAIDENGDKYFIVTDVNGTVGLGFSRELPEKGKQYKFEFLSEEKNGTRVWNEGEIENIYVVINVGINTYIVGGTDEREFFILYHLG